MITIKDIENFLNYLKKDNQELQNVIIDFDTITGKKIALARKIESGQIRIMTDYLTLKEMNQFLRGYYFKSIDRFEE